MSESVSTAALAATRRVMRPVARLMLRCGVTWKQFADAARAAFVEVATQEFGIRGRPTNVARVAILTGINRRDVKRIRDEIAAAEPPVAELWSPAHRVLAHWHQSQTYASAEQQPRPIAASGPEPSFETLLREVGGDTPPVALLKELMSAGAVVREADGRVRAVSRAYVPQQINPEKLALGASALADAGRTVVHNLTRKAAEGARFERRVIAEDIDPKHLAEFRELIERESMDLLRNLDDWLTAHKTGTGEGVRTGLGIYLFEGEEKGEDK